MGNPVVNLKLDGPNIKIIHGMQSTTKELDRTPSSPEGTQGVGGGYCSRDKSANNLKENGKSIMKCGKMGFVEPSRAKRAHCKEREFVETMHAVTESNRVSNCQLNASAAGAG